MHQLLSTHSYSCRRNEAPYLREWIEYHRLIGFDSFLLMNDNSNDDTQCILNDYAREGVVFQIPVQGNLLENNDHVFDVCVNYMHENKHTFDLDKTWMSTHDVDEFMYINTDTHDDMQDAIVHLMKLNDNQAESLKVPTLLFGSSGNDYHEPKILMERFNHRFHIDHCSQARRLTESYPRGQKGTVPAPIKQHGRRLEEKKKKFTFKTVENIK